MPVQTSIPTLVVIIPISVIGSFTIFAIGIILGLVCGIKYMQKKLKKADSKEGLSVIDETELRSIKGPIYEELDLEDKVATIDLSQNIAYAQARKTVS